MDLSQLKLRRSTILKIILAGMFSFLIGFSYNYHLPKLESYLLVQVEELSRQHSPVRVWAQRLSFHLIPLGVVLEDVKILPQAPLDKYFAPAQLKTVGARLAIWPLLRGDVRLSQVFIRDSELNVFLREDLFTAKKSSGKFKFDFDQIYNLPIDEFTLERVQIQGKLDPQDVVFKVSDLNLTIENRYRSLFVETETASIQFKPSGPVQPLTAQLELRALIEENEMQISAFKLKADQSFLVASGRANGDFGSGQVDNGAFDSRAKINLADVNAWEKVFHLKPKIPALDGRAEIDIGLELRKGQEPRLVGDMSTQDLKVDKFYFGHVEGQVNSNLKTFQSEGLVLENNSGRIRLQKLKLQLEPERAISGNIKVENVDVKELLENLSIHHVPVTVTLNADAECQGLLTENPTLNCKAKVNLPRSVVHGDKKGKDIVEFKDARATGNFKVTKEHVEYQADLEVGQKSKGRSNGVINYETGFKINYEADNLAASDLQQLASLKLEGEMKLAGSTEGTSKWATIDLKADGHDLWLEDYPMGRAVADMRYKSGHLFFNNVQGQFEVTRYTGNVELDLPNSRMKLHGLIPFVELRDVQTMFNRKTKWKFQMSGTGTGKIDAEGPLHFPDLSYRLTSSFYRGQIAGETFDEMQFKLHAVDGLVKSDQIQLTKSNGTVDFTGQITPTGIIDAVAVGRGMRLEQSEKVTHLGLEVQGLADFTVMVRGQLPDPRIELNGRLSHVVLADRPTEDSVFKLAFLGDHMEGSGQFLGNTLQSDFVIPYGDNGLFSFKLKARKWDFTKVFALISKSSEQLDFSTSVTADINLHAPQGGLWASTGQVKVDELVIRKGAKKLAAEKPMVLSVRNGVVNSENFTITSGDSYLKLEIADLDKDKLNATLNGKMDLSLFGLFTPFISDLRGNMAMSMALKGSLDKPSMSGSAYVDRAYIKFNDFIHPFSNLRADILFNDNQILINAMRADLAGGRVAGDGKVKFAGATRPVDVNASFTDVKINVPENFRSQGSGTVAINGNGFPYTMDIRYEVTGGEVTYEIGEDSSGSSTVKASTYLPRFLYEDVFHPFTFKVNTTLKNPVLINNSLMLLSATGHVTATGTPDRLILNGAFEPMPEGKVFFKDYPLNVTSAFVEFDDVTVDKAKIYLSANTRVTETVLDDQKRNTEHQYNVNLLVQGRGKNADIVLTSQPPLGQKEIVSLLALGVTSSGQDEQGSSAQATSTSTAIGAALIQKASANRLKKSLGLDVKVSSSQPTPETASQPKVTLSKQWTPKFSASASSTLEQTPANNVKLEYKMNDKVSAVGSWDAKEKLNEQKDTNRNVFGLDLEYKLNFK